MPIIIDLNGEREVTQIEYDAYIAALPVSILNFEPIADYEVKKVFEAHWYIDIGEVSAYASFANEYQNEAKSIMFWYAELYKFVKNNSCKNEKEFINKMPKYL